MKILVADDDRISRRVTERMLKQIGYDVVVADNGRDAMDKLLDRDGPRLALLDWMMPELDGPAVCQNVRAMGNRPYVYVTLLTSKSSTEDLVEGLDAGADDYLIKPCDPEELKARLRAGERVLRLEDRLMAAHEEMRFKATHDPLTNLWNRGRILQELEDALRLGQPLSVLLCDVDHFKNVNDSCGHLTGDAVLREVAQRLRTAVRQGDAIGRYGGEEFLVLLVGCEVDYLRERAEQLRVKVEEKPFVTPGAAISVTVSVGAVAVGREGGSQTALKLLHCVDKALYRAKENGRNCVIVAATSPALAATAL